MPTRAENIISFVDTRIAASQSCRNHCTESISALNATKEDHNFAIDALDTLCFNQTNDINNAINDVGTAYQSRVDAGCRSDLLWRVIDYDPGDGTPANPPEWTLECVRIEAGDYEKKSNTGIGSAFAFVEPNGTGGISSSHANAANGVLQNIVGFQTDFYHGLKIFDEPYAANVTDTYVRGGVGTCGFGTTRLYFMSPTSAGTGNDPTDPSAGIKTGMLIQSNTIGILGGTYTEIVGVETAMIDMRRIDSGISTDSTEINVLTLETPTIGIASAPQPDGTYVDKLIRVIVAITLFEAAYTAEVIRGGLQALPRGQYDAAKSLGMGYWRLHLLVILPQALKLVIPGIANTFLALVKDTPLIFVVGLLELVGMLNLAKTNPKWLGFSMEGYVFAGIIFWIICYSMSKYSQKLELKFKTDR